MDSGALLAGRRIVEIVSETDTQLVARCIHPTLDRPEMIRAWRCDSESDRERIVQRIRAVSRFDHPNITGILDHGSGGEHVWVTTRWEADESAGSFLDLMGPRSLSEVTQIATDVASALDHAHEYSVIHGAVRPETVLLGVHRARRRAKLRRFESDNRVGSGDDAAGHCTPRFLAYSAPEALNDAIEPASDQFSLACLVFELLTGRSPFLRDSALATLNAVMAAPTPSISELGDDQDRAELDAALTRALHKDPEARFPDCRSFVQSMTGTADVHPPTAFRVIAPQIRLQPIEYGYGYPGPEVDPVITAINWHVRVGHQVRPGQALVSISVKRPESPFTSPGARTIRSPLAGQILAIPDDARREFVAGMDLAVIGDWGASHSEPGALARVMLNDTHVTFDWRPQPMA